MQECPRVESKAPEDFGQSLELNSALLSMYDECRLRHRALREFELKRK